jgi:hypothetical protein
MGNGWAQRLIGIKSFADKVYESVEQPKSQPQAGDTVKSATIGQE